MFPLILIGIPTWAFLLSSLIIVLIQAFFPTVSSIIQSILWVIGLIILFTNPFPTWAFIIAFAAFAYWLAMQIYYFKYVRKSK
jgi:hypothetical protein